MYGDASDDGYLDSFDLAVERNIILEKSVWIPWGDCSGDGDVDAADLACIRNVILAKDIVKRGYEVAYDFNTTGAGTDDLALWKNVPSRPADIFISESGWTNFSSGDYDDVKAVDADSFTVGGQPGNKSAVECRFKVDETGSLRNYVTALEVEVRGNASANATMQYWAWNFSSGTWALLNNDVHVLTIENTWERWSKNWRQVFANYIDDQGHVYILVIVDTANIDLTIDYIKLELATGAPMFPCPP
jgi:hypothetical protein